MKLVLSQSAYVLLASSSLTIATWRLLQWRARKRAKIAAERVQGMVKEGPLINAEDKVVCENIVNAAIRRASKWISFQISGSVMIGQVGGVSVHKRPLLTLEPDYVMKPVQRDHRGMREIFLYEAVKVLSKKQSSHKYSALLTGTSSKKPQGPMQNMEQQNNNLHLIPAGGLTEFCDTLAMWLAMKMNDPVVAENEKLINKSWKAVKKEVETLRRLATFIPSYYGVVGQRSPMSMPKGELQAHQAVNNHMNGDSHYGMSLEAHLLLTDLTVNFQKPCVMDIKMGSESYEPDAPEDKRLREIAKYPQQETFGFRIVGMRFYEPDHPDADDNGYRRFNKLHGRSLSTLDQIEDALRLFLSAGCVKSTEPVKDQSEEKNANPAALEAEESASRPTTPVNFGSNGGGNSGGVSDGQYYAQERIRIRSLTSLLAHLRPVMGFFDENKTLCFYSSSLLLVYEGDRDASNANVSTVKMIDFGRVRRQTGGDQGYRLGLRTLKTLMDKIRKEEKVRLERGSAANTTG